LEDNYQNLWVGTAFGLDVYDNSANRFLHHLNDLNHPKSLVNNSIICLLQDKRGFIWVGTKDGLSVFNKNREVIRNFTMMDGLPSNYIVSLLEDSNGNIWMGTSNGLSNLIVEANKTEIVSFRVRNYSERDGLQGRLFNENSAFKTTKGELIFGGPNGFNIFKPQDIKVNKDIPKIVFSELQVFNKEIKPNDKVNGRVILKQSILDTEELVLKNNENVFSMSFAALNYFHPEKNKYSYKLEGFDDNWITADDKLNRITYTNLSPGEYTLKVRASNNDGYWNDNGANLKIIILPPFWKTKFAIASYIGFFLIALFIGRRVIIQRANLRFAIGKKGSDENS
jgi:hypothetical protein